MKQRFYLDTSIWRDYYENRSDSSKQLGRLALQLLLKIIKQDGQIFYSDFVVQELMIKYSKEEISTIFSIIFNLYSPRLAAGLCAWGFLRGAGARSP